MRLTRLVFLGMISLVLGFSAPAGANLLENAGFEIGDRENFEPWGRWGEAYVEPWAARTGTNGLAMYGWTTGGGAYQEVSASGASNYTFSAWGFRDAVFPTNQIAELKLEFDNANGQTIHTAIQIVAGTDTWTHYSLSAIAPAGTVTVRPVIAVGGSAGTDGAFKWDDAELTSTEAPPGGPEAFVSSEGANIYPYTNWVTAAHTIQEAVDAVITNGTVWVDDGTYVLAQQIFVQKPVTIQSMNGPEQTIVNGNGTVRCIDVIVSGVTIEGLTIFNGFVHAEEISLKGGGIRMTNGGTIRNCIVIGNRVEGEHLYTQRVFGGGIYVAGIALIENCEIRTNSLSSGGCARGGGIYATGTVRIANSEITGNFANASGYGVGVGQPGYGGGVYLDGGEIEECRISQNTVQGGSGQSSCWGEGGGIYARNARVDRCIIDNNEARAGSSMRYYETGRGGGAALLGSSVVENSLVWNNRAIGQNNVETGGGLFINGADVINCTIVSNTAVGGAGGVHADGGDNLVKNSILYYSEGTNWAAAAGATLTMSHCCTTPLPAGDGHISSEPGFVDMESGDFRLAAGSPCIDTGGDGTYSPDLDGVPRPLDGNNDGTAGWDIGAYEFIHPYADTDQDGMSDADEIRAGTDPTDPESVLKVFPPDEVVPGSGEVVIRWSSAAGRQYTLLRTTHLTNAFVTIQSDIEATPPENVWVDSTATGSGPYYYRIRLD